jgi:hypothetical protein
LASLVEETATVDSVEESTTYVVIKDVKAAEIFEGEEEREEVGTEEEENLLVKVENGAREEEVRGAQVTSNALLRPVG